MRLQFKHCTFVQAAPVKEECGVSGWVPAVLGSTSSLWSGCHEMFFLPLIRNMCVLREPGEVVESCAQSRL